MKENETWGHRKQQIQGNTLNSQQQQKQQNHKAKPNNLNLESWNCRNVVTYVEMKNVYKNVYSSLING